MLKYLECQDKSALGKTFIVHGEYKTQKNYAGFMQNSGFKNIEIPAHGAEFEI